MTPTSTTAGTKRDNFLIISKLLTKNTNDVDPSAKISSTIEYLNANRNNNQSNKNRSDSACDLFS